MNIPKRAAKDYDSFGDEICDFDDYIKLEQYCNYLEGKVKLLTIPDVRNLLIAFRDYAKKESKGFFEIPDALIDGFIESN